MSNPRKPQKPLDILFLAITGGFVGGILSYVFLGVREASPSLVPKGATTSTLAPAVAIADVGVSFFDSLWNFFVFGLGASLTGGAVAIGGLLYLHYSKRA